MVSTPATRAASLAVLVAALGYFVDIYDLILFGMVRGPSLRELGVAKADLVDQGAALLSMQMYGMLFGGIFWGMLGDKRGRLSVLFGSITLYSLANLANGMCDTIEAYSWCRLVAGFGLAGELGAGVTLVSELMGREQRGIGTTLVAAIGVAGGLLAGLIGGAFPSVPHPSWRIAYYIGGGLGLALLVLRIGVVESGMFHAAVKQAKVSRGNFFALFATPKRLVRYLAIIAVGVPVWYVIGVPFTFADALGSALGLDPAPSPATALFFCYGGCTIGGLGCGLLSQWTRSRKRALGTFLVAVAVVMIAIFAVGGTSLPVFYALCLLGGAATGYWAVFVSAAAELFGTNLRATATTTVPNFVRGSLVGVLAVFKGLMPGMSILWAAGVVGAATLVIAGIGLALLPETFGVDLDYVE
jgi:predicted MFS family arabinose efflux permease